MQRLQQGLTRSEACRVCSRFRLKPSSFLTVFVRVALSDCKASFCSRLACSCAAATAVRPLLF